MFSPNNVLVGDRVTPKVFMLRSGIPVCSELLKEPDNVDVPLLCSSMCRSPAGQHGIVDGHALSDQPAHRISTESCIISRTRVVFCGFKQGSFEQEGNGNGPIYLRRLGACDITFSPYTNLQ